MQRWQDLWMKILRRRIVLVLLVPALCRVVAADSLSDAAANAGLSVESQAQSGGTGIVIGVDAATHDRVVAVFRRTDRGSWQLDRRDLICGTLAAPAIAASDQASVEASFEARRRDSPLSIPEGRSLSDGMVRTTQSQIRSWARHLQSASNAADAYNSFQKAFEALISDIGWIDVRRFGVPSACDAASIVELSGNRRLMEGALPIMEKSLKNAEGGEGCYSRGLEAYQKLIRGH
jgi:hypothetical protein